MLLLPVSTASAERSFSTLKRLKTFIRNRIGQKRLSSLALLSINSDITKDLSVIDIGNQFVGQKPQRAVAFGKFTETGQGLS